MEVTPGDNITYEGQRNDGQLSQPFFTAMTEKTARQVVSLRQPVLVERVERAWKPFRLDGSRMQLLAAVIICALLGSAVGGLSAVVLRRPPSGVDQAIVSAGANGIVEPTLSRLERMSRPTTKATADVTSVSEADSFEEPLSRGLETGNRPSRPQSKEAYLFGVITGSGKHNAHPRRRVDISKKADTRDDDNF